METTEEVDIVIWPKIAKEWFWFQIRMKLRFGIGCQKKLITILGCMIIFCIYHNLTNSSISYAHILSFAIGCVVGQFLNSFLPFLFYREDTNHIFCRILMKPYGKEMSSTAINWMINNASLDLLKYIADFKNHTLKIENYNFHFPMVLDSMFFKTYQKKYKYYKKSLEQEKRVFLKNSLIDQKEKIIFKKNYEIDKDFKKDLL